ncbi:MAG: glutathione binding-like protein [Proteobacteria bacterium]|nr:glutathione binding-like protein [Pseudomonadota bacterium]
MIDLYFWTTPNGYKVLQFLEETGIDYRIVPVNISKGEQFDPGFLKISPNNKMPAIVDHDPIEGDEPITIFESGAILLYLAEKTGRFIPQDQKGRANVLQWLFWQMGGLGPFAGQNLHFVHYAPEILPYAIDRYVNETARLFQVMDKQLADSDYLAGDYSIADMASYPWVAIYNRLQQDLNDFPNVKRWYEQIKNRPATISAYKKGASINTIPTVTEESKKFLLGQNAKTLAA